MRVVRGAMTVVTLTLIALFVVGWIAGALPWWAALLLIAFLVAHRALWSVRLGA